MRFIKKVHNSETAVIPRTLSVCLLLVFFPLLINILLGELSSMFFECAGSSLDFCLGMLTRETLLLFVLPLLVVLIIFLWNVVQSVMSPPITSKRSEGRRMVASVGVYAIIAAVFALSFFTVIYFNFPSFLENWLALRVEQDFDELPLYSPLFILTIILGVGMGIVSILLPVIRWSRARENGAGTQSGRDD